MLSPKVITPATTSPISIDEAKLQCRVDSSDDVDLLTLFIDVARAYFEARSARTIHQTTLEITLDAWPSGDFIALPRATPLISITSITYKDSSGVTNTLSASLYGADTDNTPGRVVLNYGENWPSFTPWPNNPIRIRYVAGIATADPIVEADAITKLCVAMLVAGMFRNRESVVVADTAMISQISVKYGVEDFINTMKVNYVF